MNFSVLMSIYYKEKPSYFVTALDSVVNQTLLPNEIVIVKDGKLTKELDHICLQYKEKFPSLINLVPLEQNVGLGKALAIGVEHCRYELIARMDTDDVAVCNRFELQIQEFQNDATLSLVGSVINEFSTSIDKVDTIRSVPLTNEEIKAYTKKRNPFNHMTVMFRKKDVLKVGNYQPMYLSEDYYLWFRMIQAGLKMKNLAKPLVFARANKDMFQRRGGIKYFLQELKLQKIFYTTGFINVYELIRNLIIRAFFRLLPGKIRESLYKCLLR